MLKILANEDRLLILCQLIQGKKNVGELEQLLGIRQPTLSQQLTVLREEKLVSTERQGKYIYYSLASPEAVQIMYTLFDLYCGDEKIHAQSDDVDKRYRIKVPLRRFSRHINIQITSFPQENAP